MYFTSFRSDIILFIVCDLSTATNGRLRIHCISISEKMDIYFADAYELHPTGSRKCSLHEQSIFFSYFNPFINIIA